MSSPRELVKLYYRIGEVAQIVGVQPHVLRYWETEFRNIRPQKSGKGQRVYSRRDVEKLLKVKDLLKTQGFTIAGARKKLRDPEILAEIGARAAPAPSPEQTPMPPAPFAVDAAVVAQSSARPTPAPQPQMAMASKAAPLRSRAYEAQIKMRDALHVIRDEIRAMLDDLDAPPPRRPKLPSVP